MTAAAAPRARTTTLSACAAGLAAMLFVLAVLVALALGAVDVGGSAEAVARGTQIVRSQTISVAFGPETAAHGNDGAALGWLGALANATLAATALGPGAGAAAAAACALGALALVAWRARANGLPFVAAAAALFLLAALDALHVGGPTATLLFGAALLAALDLQTPFGVLAVGAVALVWCNVEAAGILAPLFALANAGGRALDDRRSLATRRAWYAAFAACLAALATPEGLHFPHLAVASLRVAGALGDAVAWAPDDVAPHGYRIGFVLLVSLALALGIRRERSARDALLGVVALVVALASGAFVALAAIVFAPVLATIAATRLRGDSSSRTDVRVPIVGAFAIVVVSAAFGAASGAHPSNATLRARDFSDRLHELAAVRRVRSVACTNVAWCDAAVAAGLRVLADDRIGAMPRRVARAQTVLSRARPAWRQVVDSFEIDAVVVGERATLATLLAASHWQRIAGADRVAIYVRPELPR